MKVKVLIICLLSSVFSFGQVQDLAKLADGKLVYNTTLFDSAHDLYGYFYVYKLDAKDKKTINYEFVVLDKNLNKINNGKFEGFKSTAFLESTFNDCTLMGDNLIIDKLYVSYSQGVTYILLNTFQIISLKDNSVSKEKQFKNNEFVDVDLTKLKSMKLYMDKSRFYINAYSNKYNSGFFVTDENSAKETTFFDSNLEKKWTYAYNNTDTLKNYYSDFKFRLLKDNVIYATERYNDKISKKKTFNILAINYTTGEKIYEYELDNNKDSIYHTFEFKVINNKLIVSGFYNTNIGSLDFRDYYKGIYKIVLDENGQEVEKVYHTWKYLNPKVAVNKKGMLKNGFYLKHQKTFVFDDGTISMLNEVYRPASNPAWFVPLVNWFTYIPSVTKDFIILNFDKNFNLNSVDTISKQKSRNNNTDYLFSQTLNSNKGVVFFHLNNRKDPKTKKKELMLGINSIVAGKLTQELIPLYKKKQYVITPLPAKEGYIMLRESNEKDKYNQIRLEKLNL